MKLRVSDLANRDLRAAFDFYERQQAGLGGYFMACLLADLDALPDHPGIHSVVGGNWHRAWAKRFPCAIYYKITGAEITVNAVIDCRRDPAWIRRRLLEGR
jgi:plasmid stabilization system protein ParE